MISLIDIDDRSKTGEKIAEKEYHMRIFRYCEDLVKEMNLKCDKETFTPSDDTLADEVFDASLRLATEVGAYNIDTGRVVKFTEEELKENLKAIPEEIIIGAGKDARRIIARRPDDRRPPNIFGGGAGPVREEIAVRFTESIASLPIDAFVTFNLLNISGKRIYGPLLEAWGTRRQVEMAREGITRAGKPGLHIISYPLATTPGVILGTLDSEHIRRTDSVMATHYPELYEFNYDTFLCERLAHEYGCFVYDETEGYYGGFSGGTEGTTLASTAATILAASMSMPDYAVVTLLGIRNVDLLHVPEILWGSSLAQQALTRNANIKPIGATGGSSEPGVERYFLEVAIGIISLVPNGAIVMASGRPIRPMRLDLGGPIETRFAIEIANGAAKLKREEANEIVKKISKLTPRKELEKPLKGKTFEECYDMATLSPKKDHLKLYEKMYKKILEFGLPEG